MSSSHFLRSLLVATAIAAMAACTTAANADGASDNKHPSSDQADSSQASSRDSSKDNMDKDSMNSGSSDSSSSSSSNSDAGSNAGMIADGSDFSMRPGGSVTLADQSQLRYVSMVNDSRCPPDVQCVWAGNAELAFEWKPASGGGEAFSLNTGQGDKAHVLGERTLALVSVADGGAPEAKLRIELVP